MLTTCFRQLSSTLQKSPTSGCKAKLYVFKSVTSELDTLFNLKKKRGGPQRGLCFHVP